MKESLIMPTEHLYFGIIPGYVLFWGVLVIALGLFGHRVWQLLRYMFLGRKEGAGSVRRNLAGTIGYVFSQLCQLKNLRWKDRAPLGHVLVRFDSDIDDRFAPGDHVLRFRYFPRSVGLFPCQRGLRPKKGGKRRRILYGIEREAASIIG